MVESKWRKELRRLDNGKIMSNPVNILRILENDHLLVGRFSIDDHGSWIITGDLPWRQYSEYEIYFTQRDMGGLRWYLEKNYGVYRGTRKAFKYLISKIS